MARRKAKGRRTRRVARRTTRRRPARRARRNPRRRPARKTRRVKRSTRKGQVRKTRAAGRRAYTRRNPKPFWMNPSVEPVLYGTVGIGIGYAVDSSGFAAPLTEMIPWENPNIGSIVVGLGTAIASNRFLKGPWKRRGIALGIGCAVGPWSIGMIQDTTAGFLTRNGNNNNPPLTQTQTTSPITRRYLPLQVSAPAPTNSALAAAAISGARILS